MSELIRRGAVGLRQVIRTDSRPTVVLTMGPSGARRGFIRTL